ncbi:hypothetical protein ACSS6W_009700 [Trichoderma asperelloides]
MIDGACIILPQEIVNLNRNWLHMAMTCLTTAEHLLLLPLAIVEHVLSRPQL